MLASCPRPSGVQRASPDPEFIDMVQFTLRRHAPDFGTTQPDRYTVLANGVPVGTIARVMRAGAESAWQWSIAVVPAVAPTSGTCATRDKAAAAFRAAWGRQTIDLDAWREHMTDIERRAALWTSHGH